MRTVSQGYMPLSSLTLWTLMVLLLHCSCGSLESTAMAGYSLETGGVQTMLPSLAALLHKHASVCSRHCSRADWHELHRRQGQDLTAVSPQALPLSAGSLQTAVRWCG